MAASADNTATFAIDLNAQGAKAGADAAADSIDDLRISVEDGVAELANMQKALKSLQGGTSVSIQAFQNLKKQIEAKKATIAQTQARYVELGGTFRKTKKPVDDNADALKTLLERMQKGGGPIGGLASKLQGLRGIMAGGGALVIGSVAFAAALIAVAAAATIAIAALLKYGIAAADAYRSERLQLEGLTKIRNWYGIAAGKAGDLQAAIDNVSSSSALGREQINGLAASLYRTGFRGAALENALTGVATATSAAGEAQGDLAKQMFITFGRTGAGAKKVADDIKARFGGVAAAQMLSLGVQSKKLKESFNALFRGLNIESFLGALKSITDLFSQNTASGRALKQILELALQPLIDDFTSLGPIAKRFYQGAILAAQDLTISYYNVRLALKGAFGSSDVRSNVDLLTVALNLGKIAVYSLAVGFGLVAAGLYAAYVAVKIAISPFIAFGSAVMAAWSFIASIDWSGLGSALIDGFVNGITKGIGKVVAAVKNVGKAALETLRGALDSHSPSRKGLNLGRTYPQGVGVGIDKDLPIVQKAARRVGIVIDRAANDNAPDAGGFGGGSVPTIAPGPTGPARSAAPAVMQVTVQVQVDIHAGKGEEIDEAMIRRVVRDEMTPGIQHALEGVAQSLGVKAA